MSVRYYLSEPSAKTRGSVVDNLEGERGPGGKKGTAASSKMASLCGQRRLWTMNGAMAGRDGGTLWKVNSTQTRAMRDWRTCASGLTFFLFLQDPFF